MIEYTVRIIQNDQRVAVTVLENGKPIADFPQEKAWDVEPDVTSVLSAVEDLINDHVPYHPHVNLTMRDPTA